MTKYVSFNSAYDEGIDPEVVYEARSALTRPNTSDLFDLNGTVVYTDVPDELLEACDKGHFILELGVELKVAVDPTGKRLARLGRGTQLIITSVQEYPEMYLCQADPKWPMVWVHKNSNNEVYRAPLVERRIVIVTK